MKIDIANKEVQWYIENRSLFKNLALKVQNILEEILKDEGIQVHTIQSRAKEIESFAEKINRKKYSNSKVQVQDLAGIRIIAYVENDLPKISKLINENFIVDPKSSIDKNTDLGIEKVGYKSIHYVAVLKRDRLKLPEYRKFKNINFEIQIRTILQHAWAEIEHDRSYKFSGILPDEIKRRFKLLSGSLELVDQEFNRIANEIDNITKNIKEASTSAQLDVPINSTSLKAFCSKILGDLIKSGKHDDTFYYGDKETLIIQELNNFGLYSIKNLNDLVTAAFINAYSKYSEPNDSLSTFLTILMIATDYKKYFEKRLTKKWITFDKSDVNKLKELNVPVDEIANMYNISLPK